MCCNRERHNDCDSVIRRNYNCNADQQVIKHVDVVKHRHDIIDEYEVIHEHDYNYYDVVREREVTRRHDHRHHHPDYCCEGHECGECGGELGGDSDF